MRITRTLAIALLAACGGGQEPAMQQTPVTETPVTETPADTPVTETPPPADETPAPPPPKKLTLEEKIAVQKQCFTDWVKEDASWVERCYAENAVMIQMDGMEGPIKGRAAIADNTRALWEGFTLDGEQKVILASGSTIAVIGLLSGTNDGPMMGKPATKKKFGSMFASVSTLDDQGRVVEEHLYYDPVTMMSQLGVAKTPARKAMAKSGAEPMIVIAGETDAEKANVEAVRAGFELLNNHDAKGLAAKYDAKAVFSDHAMKADIKGGKAVGATMAEYLKAFPDVNQDVTNMWAAGDYVVVETHVTGTNKGTSKTMGIKKATGKPIDLHGAHVFKLANGKAVEHWVFTNGMAFAMQLGLMKPPGPPAEPGAKAAPPAKGKAPK